MPARLTQVKQLFSQENENNATQLLLRSWIAGNVSEAKCRLLSTYNKESSSRQEKLASFDRRACHSLRSRAPGPTPGALVVSRADKGINLSALSWQSRMEMANCSRN